MKEHRNLRLQRTFTTPKTQWRDAQQSGYDAAEYEPTRTSSYNTCSVRERAEENSTRAWEIRKWGGARPTERCGAGSFRSRRKQVIRRSNGTSDVVVARNKEGGCDVASAAFVERAFGGARARRAGRRIAIENPTRTLFHSAWFARDTSGPTSDNRSCNYFGSFCVVPYTRGHESSAKAEIMATHEGGGQRTARNSLLGQIVNHYQPPTTTCDFRRCSKRA